MEWFQIVFPLGREKNNKKKINSRNIMKKQIRKLMNSLEIQELREMENNNNNSNLQGQVYFRLLNHQRILILEDIKSHKIIITKTNSEMWDYLRCVRMLTTEINFICKKVKVSREKKALQIALIWNIILMKT